MQRRTFIKNSAAAGLVAWITPTGIVQMRDRSPKAGLLEESFLNPPAAARAQTWWHWMNGNVTADGITRDLEAMKQIGLGGFQNFDAGTLIPKGPVVYLSKEWLDLKEHTIREAERLGLEFTMHNCPGWSSSGGPWITPELAMQQVTWSETFVAGGKTLSIPLPEPPGKLAYYRDVAVVAFPSLSGEIALSDLLSNATSGTQESVSINQLAGIEPGGVTVRSATEGQPAYLQFAFKEPYEARSIAFVSASVDKPVGGSPGGFGGPGAQLTLEASDDGVQFRTVAAINAGRSTEDAFSLMEFPATRATYFRLTSAGGRRYGQVRFSGAARLDNWQKKANYSFGGFDIPDAKAVSPDAIIDPKTLLNITQYVDKAGVLRWTAPAGNWTILRMGYTPTGSLNRSAPDTGIGLECDKFSQEAITAHFNKMMENLLPTLGPLARKGKVGLLIDSYEVGMQNWTARFPQAFQQRNGYAVLNYLPALTGRVVGSVDTTERFLWDLRRTQADLIADNYYGQFHQLCHQNGIISYTEPYDRGPMEEMQIGARVDVNMGEYWNGLSSLFQNNWTMRRTTKLAASITHINGKKGTADAPAGPQVVGAEAFTGEPESARWQEYPFAMKALGDRMFTQGLSRIIFHRYAHQPHPTALPGMTMGPWGIHFDRTATWWNQGRAWLDYIARCQSLLQQGLFVADLAYFTGEEGNQYAKVTPDELSPAPPPGYDYDLINAEVMLNRVQVENGRLVLPDGMSYRVLVLQDHKALSLTLVKKLHRLVSAGMVLVGAKPEKSLGLRASTAPAGTPERDRPGESTPGDAEFNRLTTALWGPVNGTTVTEHRVGAGRVCWGKPLQTVLDTLQLKPDFEVSSRSGDAPITYIHRRIASADVYFLANQRRTTEDVVCLFRVGNKQPELWDANTGQTTPVRLYERVDGQVRMPLQLDPSGSVFVVFRNPAATNRLQAVLKDNTAILSTKPFPPPARAQYAAVSDTFTISFWAKPEINVMLNPNGFREGIALPWTDYYAIYPPDGQKLYGAGHAACGLTVGRNGVAIWERTNGKPTFILAAPVPVTGWSHVAVVYTAGVPAIYVNGKRIQQGKKSQHVVHPGVGKAYLSDEASYYNGDMSEPQVLPSALSDEQVGQLATQPVPEKPASLLADMVSMTGSGLRFWQNGRYTLRDQAGRDTPLTVSGIGQPMTLRGPWQVRFPPSLGAPEQITLPELVSLHTHSQAGVRYFSGTAAYTKTVNLPATMLAPKKRVYLDLGRVEVLADVVVNGKELGTLWKRPYQIDVTDALKAGTNTLEIRATNLWPNRLIGDEQLPEPDKFTPGGGASGFASLSNGAMIELPDWYKQGKPKPADGRVTFTTWKHYTKESPLLESGLIGPVMLRVAAVV